jgi:hypothetical protein
MWRVGRRLRDWRQAGLQRRLMIFQGIYIVAFITRAQYELCACGWLAIEDVAKVKAGR